jgi:hypothetical protein
MKTFKLEYVFLANLFTAKEYDLFMERCLHKLDLGNATIHLFSATDIARIIEAIIGGATGRNMALKVCSVPEHALIRVEE